MAKKNRQWPEYVVRLAQDLAAEEVGILVLSPYSRPKVWDKSCAKLLREGLVERDPGAERDTFRITEKGDEVLQYLLRERY